MKARVNSLPLSKISWTSFPQNTENSTVRNSPPCCFSVSFCYLSVCFHFLPFLFCDVPLRDDALPGDVLPDVVLLEDDLSRTVPFLVCEVFRIFREVPDGRLLARRLLLLWICRYFSTANRMRKRITTAAMTPMINFAMNGKESVSALFSFTCTVSPFSWVSPETYSLVRTTSALPTFCHLYVYVTVPVWFCSSVISISRSRSAKSTPAGRTT